MERKLQEAPLLMREGELECEIRRHHGRETAERMLHQSSVGRTETLMREKRLYEASVSGSVESLTELMEEDTLTLARVSITLFNESPLHIAAMLGHADFVKALLRYKPDLARELDSQGRSPLHLASANGYDEIVKELLLVDSRACIIRDEDGRTPLHLSVIKGRAQVIKELVRAHPETIRWTLDRGETLLHSCVKHNRLESLTTLMESHRVGDLINVRDEDGNTILHLATAMKQFRTIKYLLSGLEHLNINAMNGNGFTALDIIECMPRDLKGMEIRESLLQAGGLRARSINRHALACNTRQIITGSEIYPPQANHEAIAPPSNDPWTVPIAQPPSEGRSAEKHWKKSEDWLNKKRDALMVAATVIAAMAYQAGFNPPSGVWQEAVRDPNNDKVILHQAGTSIMAVNYPDWYSIFWKCNTVSFVASLSTILLLVSGLPLKRRIVVWILMVAMLATITSMALTYLISVQSISPDREKDGIVCVVGNSVLLWLGLILLMHCVRFLGWSLHEVRKLRKTRPSRITDEGQGEGQGNV